jgi:hypothetical protein
MVGNLNTCSSERVAASHFWVYKTWITHKIFKQVFCTRKCIYIFGPLCKSSGYALELYSKDTSFESRSSYWLSSKRVFVIFSLWANDWLEHSNRPRLPSYESLITRLRGQIIIIPVMYSERSRVRIWVRRPGILSMFEWFSSVRPGNCEVAL